MPEDKKDPSKEDEKRDEFAQVVAMTIRDIEKRKSRIHTIPLNEEFLEWLFSQAEEDKESDK